MKGFRMIGVTRSNQYSPNHIGNDAAIFNETVRHLQEAGCEITIYNEEEFLLSDIKAPVIFTMARNQQTIVRLKQLQEQGTVIVNSGFGIENCTREKMTRLLLSHGVPHPRSLIVQTKDNVQSFLDHDNFIPCWIKRGDFHAIHREDVSFVRNPQEGQNILSEYALRGIESAVINEHLSGDLIKFYGVADTGFFHWFYPYDMNHSKFGLEKINGAARGLSFDPDHLKNICHQASEVLGVKIYGGDCIVAEDGSIRIIDFNDWPSFAPCRDLASPNIARCILQEASLAAFKVVNHTLKLR
ncbi:MAG: ATP-grasp domain-containing protein [Bacteroidales bacterium]